MGTDSVNGSPLFAERLPAHAPEQALASVAVLGLGYVGLPTSIGLAEQGMRVIGVDVSERRLQDVREGSVDLAGPERDRLQSAIELGGLTLTSDPGALQSADAVVICVPTPVDETLAPDLRFIRAACSTAVAAGTARSDDRAHQHDVRGHHPRAAGPAACGSRAAPGPRGVRRLLARAHRPRQPPLQPGGRAAGRGGSHHPMRACRRGSRRWSRGSGARRLLAGGGRDDEALREHLPRREHRVRERDGRREPQLRARPDRGHAGCGDQAVRLHALLSGPGRRRALHPLRPALPAQGTARAGAATRPSPSVR